MTRLLTFVLASVLTVVTTVFAADTPKAVKAKASTPVTAKAALKTICTAHPAEPACKKQVLVASLKGADAPALESAFSTFQNAVGELKTNSSQLTSCQPLLSAYAALLSSPNDADVIAVLAKEVDTLTQGGGACHSSARWRISRPIASLTKPNQGSAR